VVAHKPFCACRNFMCEATTPSARSKGAFAAFSWMSLHPSSRGGELNLRPPIHSHLLQPLLHFFRRCAAALILSAIALLGQTAPTAIQFTDVTKVPGIHVHPLHPAFGKKHLSGNASVQALPLSITTGMAAGLVFHERQGLGPVSAGRTSTVQLFRNNHNGTSRTSLAPPVSGWSIRTGLGRRRLRQRRRTTTCS